MNQDLQTKIREAAASRGLDPDTVLRIVGAESTFDTSAKNPKSSARGLFQITDQTWKDFGGTKEGRGNLDENIRVGLNIISSNKSIFEKKFGREPSQAELYGMHFLGAKDAPRVLSADPNASLKNIVPEKVVKANPFLQKMSVSDFIAFAEKKMGAKSVPKQASRPTAPAKRVETPEIAPGTAMFIGAQAPKPKAIPLRDQVADLGPSYDAAMASVALADTRDDDEDDDVSVSEKEESASIFSEVPMVDPFSYLEEEPAVNLASGEVRNPQRLAFGGLPYAPSAMIAPSTKEFVREAKSAYDTYNSQINAYNAAYKKWETDVYNPYLARVAQYNKEVDDFNARANRYLESYWGGDNPGVYSVKPTFGGTTGGLSIDQGDLPEELSRAASSFFVSGGKLGVQGTKGFNKFHTPEELVKTGYNPTGNVWSNLKFKNVDEAQDYLNSLPSYQAYRWMQENQAEFQQPDNKQQYYVLRKGPDRNMASPGEFKKTAPAEPAQFAVAAPTAPSVSQEEVQARINEAQKKQKSLQLVYDVLSDPDRFNLSLPKMFAHGGAVHRADGSPVYGEMADTGGITDDTRAALSKSQGLSAKDLMDTLKRVYGEGVSNLESVVRGSAAAIPGFAGDIGQDFDIRGLRNLPSTEQILKATPRATKPTKEGAGFEEVGTYMPLPASPSMVKGSAKATMEAFKKSAPTAETVIQMGPAVEATVNKVAPVVKPMQVVEQTTATVADGLRPADQMFISKVDDFIAGQRNPVTKQQLLGQMRGKFRDYEIGRVEQALADLPDAAKIMPQDLSARVAKTFPASDLRTSIIEPKNFGMHNTMDNPYGDRLVGSVNLSLPVTDVAKKISDEATLTQSKLLHIFNGDVTAVDLDNMYAYLKKEGLSSDYKNLLKAFDKIRGDLQVLDKTRVVTDDLYRAVKYPSLHSKYDEIFAAIKKKNPTLDYDVRSNMAREELLKQAAKELKNMKVAIPKGMDIKSEAFKSFVQEQASLKLNAAKEAFKDVARGMDKEVLLERNALDEQLKKKLVYYGQHKNITPEGGNISFSRFVDQETKLPDLGNKKVMHFVELQSDRLDDLLKRGAKTGSKEKDLAEVASIDEKINKMLFSDPAVADAIERLKKVQYSSGQYINAPKAKSEAVQSVLNQYPGQKKDLIEYLRLNDRRAKINARARYGDYMLEEAFAGMDKSPQAVQQLLIKNAIGAAMQRGVNVITFPGKESAQAQLYEKLPANLKQVVKDLGTGFDIRPIELYDDKGNMFTHVGLVWDDKTAQRILKEGIRFNKGGMVDKNDLDYAKYI